MYASSNEQNRKSLVHWNSLNSSTFISLTVLRVEYFANFPNFLIIERSTADILWNIRTILHTPLNCLIFLRKGSRISEGIAFETLEWALCTLFLQTLNNKVLVHHCNIMLLAWFDCVVEHKQCCFKWCDVSIIYANICLIAITTVDTKKLKLCIDLLYPWFHSNICLQFLLCYQRNILRLCV